MIMLSQHLIRDVLEIKKTVFGNWNDSASWSRANGDFAMAPIRSFNFHF